VRGYDREKYVHRGRTRAIDLESLALESTQKCAATLGDKPSLISWRPFCAEGD
jgi:hypothetical protein